MILQLLKAGLAAVLFAAILSVTRQCRRPHGWFGRLVLGMMNRHHSSVTDWGLSHVSLARQFSILDVGCGGGRTIQTLAATAVEGRVCGIDYSPASVAAARRVNADAIAAGRVEIQEGSVSHLPYPDVTFDLVSAVETHYYWPDLPSDLREVWRVLKPGGHLAIIAESYRGRPGDALFQPLMRLLGATYLSAGEHRDLLTAAGFVDVIIAEEHRKGWICAIAGRALVPEGSTLSQS